MVDAQNLIRCRCPECETGFRVKRVAAGKQVTCRECGGTFQIPKPTPRRSTDGKPATSNRPSKAKARLDAIVEGFEGDFPRPRVSLAHRLVALIVVSLMLLLPVIYLGFAAGVGWLTYWHATHNYTWMEIPSGRAKLLAGLAYVSLIIGGGLWFLSLIKPLFLRFTDHEVQEGIRREEEPVLYAFCDRLADAVGAPRPDVIQLCLDVNASASYETEFFGLKRKGFVLTLGIPLVAGMTLPQLTGVIAHEFGHFSQKGSTLLNRMIYRINMWFAAAVYRHDTADDAIASLTDEDGHWTFFVIGMVSWVLLNLGRAVLWCLMYVGIAVSSSLSRRMEFDADQYEAGVVGSDMFVKSSRRLIELMVADAVAKEHIFSSLDARSLPDNYPQFVAGLADRYPRVRKKARKLVEEEKGSMFASHPTTNSRIAAAKRLDRPGIFKLDRPAKDVFRGFDHFARDLTHFLYSLRFGQEINPAELSRTDEALKTYISTMTR